MSRVPDVRPKARADMLEYATYLADDSLNVALRFLDQAEETMAYVAAHPGIGRPCEILHPSLDGLRSVAVNGFPNHLIFYRVLETQAVVVVRVRHGAMDIGAVEMGE